MVIGLPAVPALDAKRGLGTDAGGVERQWHGSRQRPDDRQHCRAGPPSGGWRKRGTQKQGFGRSKGGFTTKIHLVTNADGLPVTAEITGGEVSDYKGYDLVMADDRPGPKVLIADKGYDADRIRDAIEQTGGTAVIPARRSRKAPVPIDGFIYALRNRIERCFNKLKNSRRLATRYDKTADSYLGFIHIAAIRLWIRHFVNAT
jgi:transposase